MRNQRDFNGQTPTILGNHLGDGRLNVEIAVGMVFQLADGTIRACNTAAEKILGFTLEQMLNSTSLDHLWQTIQEDGSLFPGNAHPAMLALRTGQPVTGVVMGVYQPNGNLIWIKIDAQPLFETNNLAPWAVVTTFSEITAQRSVQAELTQPNYLPRHIYNSLNLDDVLHATVWSVHQLLQTERVLVFCFEPDLESGRVVAEAVEDPWVALLSNSFHDPCFVHYAEWYRQGRVTAISDINTVELESCYREFLTRLQVQANLVVPILLDETLWGLLVAQQCSAPRTWHLDEIELLQQLATQVGIALHRVELYVQAQAEITQRRHTERRLRESQEQLILGVQVAGVALAKFNYASNTVELSKEAAALYGLPIDELVVTRERVHATFHPEERAELLDIIEKVLDPMGAGWFSREHRVVWENGEVRWLFVRKQVFFDGSGAEVRPCYAILAAIDITERKQADIELERLLQQEQAARAEAERANRIKDEFLAVLSHELRSPLNPILGWTSLLKQRKLNETRTREALATIERNAKLQVQLIDDLLDISRIMQGKLSINAVPVNLAFVISAAHDTVRLAAEARNIQVKLLTANHTIEVSGDGGRLQQVIWNLLSNAVKFTPTGGQVQVKLTQAGSYAQIQVIDTGKGINPEFLPYVFEYFRQEDSATTRKFGGLGLGLAIARQITELHGGSIEVYSAGENQGATFTVKLPLLRAKNNQIELDDSGVLMPQLIAAPLANVRVLIVDDDRDNCDFLAFLLQESGAQVIAKSSGIEALRILEQKCFDVLLSDIGMPEIDGYTLIRAIREQTYKLNSQIPAIALTAYAGEIDKQKALKAGFQYHLAKPIIYPDEVIALIIQLVQ